MAMTEKGSSCPVRPVVLLFDGECAMCGGIAGFVRKRDRSETFAFQSLRTEEGRRLLEALGIEKDDCDTFVMIRGGKYWLKSDAALQVMRELGRGWSLLYTAKIVPKRVRDFFYDRIAERRYKWFGRVAAETACTLPTNGKVKQSTVKEGARK
ncbi:thiol-disulfide oxidoreductase DCC family protein [Paenibacillus sp. NPDC058071]|uniref:thiol-disulfide oxidoreductase DCC family protein n=1 Tax=Paenibacillus sp. NPDC058071 TaxID=3346326 RepID=UPI0036D8F7B7